MRRWCPNCEATTMERNSDTEIGGFKVFTTHCMSCGVLLYKTATLIKKIGNYLTINVATDNLNMKLGEGQGGSV